MKKISLLKGIALSVSALMVFSLSGCDYIDKILDGVNSGGNNNNITGDDNNTTEPQITISKTEITLAVDDTYQLFAFSSDGAQISWGTSDPTVATVEDGLVTGLAEGDAVIWAETESLMKTCAVKVVADQTTLPPTEPTIELPFEELSLKVGNSSPMFADCSVKDATVKWTSSNPAVVKVEQIGDQSNVVNVFALKEGFAYVSASVDLPTGKTLTARCLVTVTKPADSDKPGYTLVWNDEFSGTSLDTTKWNYQTGIKDQYGTATGPDYWGNGELQYYTQDAVSVSNGSLKITATKQQMGDRPYTSGRILTRDKAKWTYGYFEAKMKTPTGDGMWPAFWMLPQPGGSNTLENQYGGWPANGEIDVMEAKGRLGNKVDTTLHFGKAWNAHDYVSKETELSSNTDQWHTYAVDWTSDAITWYVDGKNVLTVDKYRWWSQDDSNKGQSMPFDKPFYLIFNLAVGGIYDSSTEPDYATFTSKTMEVDYVRVYKKA